jgi:hypothetical protein
MEVPAMQQAKFSIEEEQAKFLGDYERYGFRDRSAMLREALNRFERELQTKALRESAAKYAELCEEDSETTELAESALEGWPE